MKFEVWILKLEAQSWSVKSEIEIKFKVEIGVWNWCSKFRFKVRFWNSKYFSNLHCEVEVWCIHSRWKIELWSYKIMLDVDHRGKVSLSLFSFLHYRCHYLCANSLSLIIQVIQTAIENLWLLGHEDIDSTVKWVSLW